MMEESVFENGLWQWVYVDEDDNSVNKMPMHLQSDVRVAVLGVNFYDKTGGEVNPENITDNNVNLGTVSLNSNSLASVGKTVKTEAGAVSAAGAAGLNGIPLTIADRMKT